MITGYVLLYCIYILIVHCVAFLFTNVKIDKSRMKIVLLSIIALGALIAAFRPEKTQDTEIYNEVYHNSLDYLKNIRIISIKDIFANRSNNSIELFYIIIMAFFKRIFPSPTVFYFIQGVLSNALMVQGLYLLCEYIFEFKTNEEKEKFFNKKIFLLFSLYQLYCGLLYTSSAIRDGLSLGIGIFALASILTKKRRIIPIIMLIISFLIHTTSIVLIFILLLLWIWKSRINVLSIWSLYIMIPIMYFLKIGAVFVGFITPLIEKGLKLLNIQAFYSYITQLEYQLPLREGFFLSIASLIMVFVSMIIKRSIRTDKYIFVVFIGLLIFVLAYPIPALARLLYIFVLFLLPLVMKVNKKGFIIHMIWIFFFIPQYIYVFSYIL